MKKLFLAGLLMCSLFVAQHSFAQDSASGADYAQNAMAQDSSSEGSEHYWSQDGRRWSPGACSLEGCDTPRADAPCGDQPTGECWCKYVHYEPCYYYTKRCVTENKYCTKKCTRQVPRYYQVTKCRYVPQYYTETACKMETECYDVQECIPCKKWVCDRHCKYVPRYYYKHVCGQPNCPTPCPSN